MLHSIPEIVELVGATNTNLVLQTNDEDDEEKVKPVLKAVFTDLMSADKERVTDAVNILKSRLLQENEVCSLHGLFGFKSLTYALIYHSGSVPFIPILLFRYNIVHVNMSENMWQFKSVPRFI